MDVYGKGQDFGIAVVAYCRKMGIDIDTFFAELRANPGHFISGIGDGIGGHRNQKRLNSDIEQLFMSDDKK